MESEADRQRCAAERGEPAEVPPEVPKRKQPWRVHAWVCPDCGGMVARMGKRCEHCGKLRTFGGLLIWADADEQLFVSLPQGNVYAERLRAALSEGANLSGVKHASIDGR